MSMIRLSSADTDVVVNALVWLRCLTVICFAIGSGRTFSHADKLCFKNNVMLNELPVLTGCGVNLSVAGKGKGQPGPWGMHTMPHQLDVGPTVIAQFPRCQPQLLLWLFYNVI